MLGAVAAGEATSRAEIARRTSLARSTVGQQVDHLLRRGILEETEIGEVVAMLVHMYNPRTLVLGGPMSEQLDELLSGVRAVVYQRALPLAIRRLTITTTEPGSEPGLTGAVALAARDIFSPDGITRLLQSCPHV
ncbi:hypothetical protein ABZY02_20020 [Streptomyces sp. NPDC006649]|uniref:hypothetical protein n=1 Tax=Streptomyces sp. NPDC006649 TaxID=3156896 RepID=UPI0033B3940D